MINGNIPLQLQVKSFSSDPSTLKLKAVVSSQVLDRDGELVDLGDVSFRSVDGVLDIPLLADHQHRDINSVLGSVDKAEVVNGELIFDITFSNKTARSIDAYYLIADGHIKNPFSIGFSYKEFDGVTYKGIDIFEVSVTAMASNPRARVLEMLGKSENAELVTAVTKAIYSLEGEQEDDQEAGEEQAELVQEAQDISVREEEHGKEIDNTDEVIKEEISIMNEEQIKAMLEAQAAAIKSQVETEMAEKAEADKQAKAAKKAARVEADASILSFKDSKELFTIKSLRAAKNGNRDELAKLNEQAAKAYGLSEKAVHDYTNMGQAILCEELDREINRCVDTNFGAIGAYVGKFNLSESNKYSYMNVTGQLDYQDIENCEPKPDGGNLSATKVSKEVREKALQGAVCDNLADDMAVDIYQQIRDELARAENRLIGDIVFNYDGGGIAANATGILVTPGVPTLAVTAADRKSKLRGAIMSLCAGARAGAIWAMSEQTWYDCVLPLLDCDKDCGTELRGTDFGQMIETLWKRPIITDNSIPNGTIVLGDFRNFYKYVTKGARKIEFDPHAYSKVLDISGWDNDVTLFRSHLRATGVVKDPTAFLVMTCS